MKSSKFVLFFLDKCSSSKNGLAFENKDNGARIVGQMRIQIVQSETRDLSLWAKCNYIWTSLHFLTYLRPIKYFLSTLLKDTFWNIRIIFCPTETDRITNCWICKLWRMWKSIHSVDRYKCTYGMITFIPAQSISSCWHDYAD